MGWLTIALALIQLAPSILQLIMQVEQIFQGAGAADGTGAAKKAIVLSAISNADATVQAKAGAFIDNAVNTFNGAGIFKKAS